MFSCDEAHGSYISVYFIVVQPIGYKSEKFHNFVKIPEMIPEFIVPDLTDFKVSTIPRNGTRLQSTHI